MTEIMMTYKPSPKPNFFKPTHIKYNSMDTYMWGDEEAGNVKDWIYVSNESLHQIIFGMEKGVNLNTPISIELYLEPMNYYMFSQVL